MTSRPTRVALVCGSDHRLMLAIAERMVANRVAVAILAAAGADTGYLAARTTLPVVSWDVGDHQACAQGIRHVEARLGSLDILINGANVAHECSLRELTQPMWRDVIKVNLGGCFNLVSAVFPAMCARGFGRIVSIAPTEEATGSIANRAAAAAMQGFMRALALEGACDSVTANHIALGSRADGEGTPGWLQDAADALAFLCADSSGHVTGSTLTVGAPGTPRP